MSIVHRIAGWVILAASVIVLPAGVQAEGWSAPLQGGGTVTVDPRTNRATVTKDGVQSLARDGVHQLQDGTTLIIHSGQAIPNEGILRARQLPAGPEPTDADQWIGAPIVGY